MSTVGLFVAGTLVTLIVAASMALLVWGAILDGRDQRTYEEAEREKGKPEDGRRLHVIDAA